MSETRAFAAPLSASVAGIDRWKGGWIIADVTGTELSFWCAPTIAEAVDELAHHAVVAIDMPIALAVTGRRAAEAEVRAVLGASARSVFTSPTRAAAKAVSQAQATELNRARGGPGISAQAFGLFASIMELRSTLRHDRDAHWWETHPETSFVILNDGVPMASKRTGLGVGQRLAALRALFPTLDDQLLNLPPKVPIDDALDALAAAWSAQRIDAGIATLFGPEGRDDEGFAEGIRV